MSDLGVIAAVVLAYALVSARLERTAITAPMAFVAAGILAGPDVLGLVGLELTSGTGLTVAEVALVIVLFADASRIDLRALRGNRAALPVRLLGIGMPLTIGLGVIAGAILLGGLELWEAAIVAAVLAPTDAALGAVVVESPRVPQRIRQALNVESGLNDGLSVPFLFLFVALAAEQALDATGWVSFAAEQIGLGALAGLVVGGAGGMLVDHASRRGSITGGFQQLAILALAVGAWALAGELDGNGFIAAFVAGMAAGRITEVCGERILDFTEDEGQLLTLVVFFIFGVGALSYLDALSWEIAVFAVLSLTLVRIVPVAIATLGTGLRASTVAFLGWFGPRGLASIILALVVVEEEPELPAIDVLLAAMTVTVLLSVVAHGVSARPLVGAYGRRVEALPPDAPELESAPEMPTRGGGMSG